MFLAKVALSNLHDFSLCHRFYIQSNFNFLLPLNKEPLNLGCPILSHKAQQKGGKEYNSDPGLLFPSFPAPYVNFLRYPSFTVSTIPPPPPPGVLLSTCLLKQTIKNSKAYKR